MDENDERRTVKYCEFEVQGQLYSGDLSGELACERVKRTGNDIRLELGRHIVKGRKHSLLKPFLLLQVQAKGLEYRVVGLVRNKFTFDERPEIV